MNEQLQCQLADACKFHGILERYNTAIKEMEQRSFEAFEKYSALRSKRFSAVGGIVIFIFVYIMLSIVLLLVGGGLGAAIVTNNVKLLYPIGILLIFISCTNLFIPLGIPIGIITYKSTYCRKKDEQLIAEAEKYFEEVYCPIEQECSNNIQNLTNERNEFVNANKHILQFLPEEYRNATAVIYMEQAVRNCRADSLKEAINLYEDQLHKWKIEQQNQELLDQQALQNYLIEEQRDAMDRLRREQRSTNTALAGIEALQFYNTFCR